MYKWTSEYARKEDGRVRCYVPGIGRKYRSRLIYCNTHSLSLEDIDGYSVHHKDEDRTNDDPNNLKLVNDIQHANAHPGRSSGRRSDSIRKNFSGIQKELWRKGFYKNRPSRKSKYHDLIDIILKMHDKGEPKASIDRKLKIPRSSVYNILYKEKKI